MNARSKSSILVLVASVLILPTFAQEKPAWVSPLPDIVGNPAAGRIKAEPCATCHGPVGLSNHNYYPNLAGQKEEYLLFQLHYYRSGKRPHQLMSPLAEVLSDVDIADLSAFYASIKVTQVTDQNINHE